MQNLKVFGAILVVILVLSLVFQIQAVAPKNVQVMLDHKYKTYISPDCLYMYSNIDFNSKDFEPNTFEKARTLKYDPDSQCTEKSIFPSRNVLSYILEKSGIIGSMTKWNTDGTWNY